MNEPLLQNDQVTNEALKRKEKIFKTNFENYCQKNLKKKQIQVEEVDNSYNTTDSDKLFHAENSDWAEDEFVDEIYTKIKYGTPNSPCIIVLIPAFSKVFVMLLKDVPARLKMYEYHIIFLDNTMTPDELRQKYFNMLDEKVGRDLFALMTVTQISNPHEIKQFLQLWSGKYL